MLALSLCVRGRGAVPNSFNIFITSLNGGL